MRRREALAALGLGFGRRACDALRRARQFLLQAVESSAEAPGAVATAATSFFVGIVIVIVFGWMVIEAQPGP